VTQIVNAITMWLVIYFLINLANDHELKDSYANKMFQKNLAIIGSAVIVLASKFTIIAVFFRSSAYLWSEDEKRSLMFFVSSFCNTLSAKEKC
jgi:hypothetical protein